MFTIKQFHDIREILEVTNNGQMTVVVERPQADAFRKHHYQLVPLVNTVSLKGKGAPLYFMTAKTPDVFSELREAMGNFSIISPDGKIVPASS